MTPSKFRASACSFDDSRNSSGNLMNWPSKPTCCCPDHEALRSLPGIGPALALTVLAEAGDLRRFAHH
jgi:hypothetical protein